MDNTSIYTFIFPTQCSHTEDQAIMFLNTHSRTAFYNVPLKYSVALLPYWETAMLSHIVIV